MASTTLAHRQDQPDLWLDVFRLRDIPMEPARGMHKSATWLQFAGSLQLRLALQGPEWKGVKQDEFEVKISETELSVGSSRDSTGLLKELCGKLKKEVDPNLSAFGIEGGVASRIFVVNLAKKLPGKPWNNGVLSEQLFNRQYFGWGPNAQPRDDAEREEVARWVRLQSGFRRDVDDPYVTCRSWLCSELEETQTETEIQFRIILSQKKLNECLEKVPYYRLWGVDVSERYFKLFIRGDEPSPVLLGELGGECIPDRTKLELTTHTREVEGHRIVGTMETLPCLLVTLQKAASSTEEWPHLLHSTEEDMNSPVGSLEEYVRRSRKADASPDRSCWTEEEWAHENKARADKAFKEGCFGDAVVYYTRALKNAPDNEKLLSNRSAAYCKLSKFQLALDDAVKAEWLAPTWEKVYFRKAQALRGLRQFQEAIAVFQTGKELDAGSGEWDKEIRRTVEVQAAVQAKKVAKEISAKN